MGENCGSWFPRQPFDSQSSYLNSWSTPLHLPQQITAPSFMKPDTYMVSANMNLPEYSFPKLSDSQGGHTMEPHAWFCSLPHLPQAFMPANSVLKEKLSSVASDNCHEATTVKAESVSGQKKFLVVDQSGDQTTLIFGSGTGTPVHCLTSWNPKPSIACNLNMQDREAKERSNFHSPPILTDEVGENNVSENLSEMHEDTEELNALLYSDDSGYSEEDEVTSTGHSPSTVTLHDKQDWFEGSAEEVASSMGLTKKRKLSDRGDGNVEIMLAAATSIKPSCSEYEDDAQSSCADVQNPGSDEEAFSSCNKRMRKDKLRETVLDFLQSIVPGGRGKDAIMILDDAIHYLETLKLKAKTLGLDTI